MTEQVLRRPNEICPHCGAEYEVSAVKLEHIGGSHEQRCQCGFRLRSWRGLISFRYRPLDAPSASENDGSVAS